MSEDCNDKCSECASECSDRKEEFDFAEKLHGLSSVKKVIGIVSGKGGVGKSSVTSMLAVEMNRRGHNVAILDADVTGPSIPRSFGLETKAVGDKTGLFPVLSSTGIQIMSINLLLENDTDPVVWRGPIIAGTVKQFWTDVIWKDVDYMFIDMPPGTGDVPLTVFQSLAIDGVIIVTSPQELVSMIVTKAVNMAKMMKIPIIGIVENMSYFKCPDCDNIHNIFGESHLDEIAQAHNIENISRLPMDPSIAKACDLGMIEHSDIHWIENMADAIE